MTSISPLPFVGVLPTIKQGGMNYPGEQGVPPLEIASFEDAFSQQWDTDAHFVTYTPYPNAAPDAEFPRCNKPLLPLLRAQKSSDYPEGIDLHATMLVLDYDNPIGHEQWTAGSMAVFLEQLQALADTWPLAWDFTLFYTTRKGARFVYVLDRPVSVDAAEQHHQWLCSQFHERGMYVDTNVSDWTRLFRLPWVIRGSTPTWVEANPAMQVIRNYDARLCVDSLGKSAVKATRPQDEIRAPIVEITDPMPDLDEALALLENVSGKRISSTPWFKMAKQALKGRACHDCIVHGVPLAAQGSRDATIIEFVGQAIGMCKRIHGTTPAHIFALFVPAVGQLEPDNGNPDWYATLWSAVKRIWARDQAKEETVAVEQRVSEETAIAMFRSMAKGMRNWCDCPVLEHADAATESVEFGQLMDWVSRRLIVSTPRGFTILLPNGYYDKTELQKHQLIMHWRIQGMDIISPSKVQRDDGRGYRDITAIEIMNQHGFVVNDIQGRSSLEGAIIERIESDSPTLVLPLFSRNQYLLRTAERSADVEQWLHHFFGEHYDEGIEWIRWALAFEEGPIAALSIAGGQGAGKKMFTQGLAECLSSPKLADGTDIVSQWNYGLLESPFLVVNEGWPQGSQNESPADKFRHYVGGDPIRVQRRFMSPVEIRNPMRVIFTANNLNVIRGLTGLRDLSPDDREALFIRIIHYNIGHKASLYLANKGGLAFTAKEGKRWIAGDAGQQSNYIVARHFLWLYKTRKLRPIDAGGRLLVQGGKNPEIMFDMRTNSGRAPLVMETIFRMLDSGQIKNPMFGMVVWEKRIFVLTAEIIKFARAADVNQIKALTMQQVQSVLRGMITHETKGSTMIPGREALERARWHELDVGLLKSVADRDGYFCKELNRIVGVRDEDVVNESIESQTRPGFIE